MKLVQQFALGLLVIAPIASYGSSAPGDTPGRGKVTAQFSVDEQTQIPSKILKKGDYTIRILDHLSDRMVLQVDQNGKLLSTFLALPSSGLPKPASQGPITLGAGVNAKSAIRGFAFPDGTVAEFVYPKAEAVGLAKANDTKIPAIDPASQGLTGNPALSKTDREMVALWMLSPTPVGPNDSGPGIKAERYQPQQASAATPPRPRQHPAVAALPHTAGYLPLVLLGAIVSTLGATVLTRRRLTI
jgi:hypothetical protein